MRRRRPAGTRRPPSRPPDTDAGRCFLVGSTHSVLAYAHKQVALSKGTILALARTNLTLPEELIREVDEVAGPRGRSRYVAEAVTQRLKRDRLRQAVEATAGIFRGTPHEMSREQVSAWIEGLRSEESD